MKRIILLVSVAMCMQLLYAQNTLQPNLYFQDMNYYNVAAGLMNTKKDNQLSVHGKHKFVDNDVWKKNPSVYVNYLSRMEGSKSTYSVSYIYDNYSFYNRHIAYLGYTHKKDIAPNHSLSIGGRAVLNFDRVNWNKLPQVQHKTGINTYFVPDIDLGVMYQYNRLLVGLAVKNLFANSKTVDNEKLLENRREWYSNISYRISVGDKIEITPYSLLAMSRKISADIGLHTAFNSRIVASYHFRTDGFRNVGMLGINITENTHLGATIDYSPIHDDKNVEAYLGYSF